MECYCHRLNGLKFNIHVKQGYDVSLKDDIFVTKGYDGLLNFFSISYRCLSVSFLFCIHNLALSSVL